MQKRRLRKKTASKQTSQASAAASQQTSSQAMETVQSDAPYDVTDSHEFADPDEEGVTGGLRWVKKSDIETLLPQPDLESARLAMKQVLTTMEKQTQGKITGMHAKVDVEIWLAPQLVHRSL